MSTENMVSQCVLDKVQSMLDESIRMGNISVSQANRYMHVSKLFADAIEQAIQFIETGRHAQARDRLKQALVAAAGVVK